MKQIMKKVYSGAKLFIKKLYIYIYWGLVLVS